MCRQTQMCRAMVGAAAETLYFLLLWEHVGGDRVSRVSGLQVLFCSRLCPSRKETCKLRLSWGLCKPSQACKLESISGSVWCFSGP